MDSSPPQRLGPVILTGATGFVGSHVLRRLLELDCASEVRAATRAAPVDADGRRRWQPGNACDCAGVHREAAARRRCVSHARATVPLQGRCEASPLDCNTCLPPSCGNWAGRSAVWCDAPRPSCRRWRPRRLSACASASGAPRPAAGLQGSRTRASEAGLAVWRRDLEAPDWQATLTPVLRGAEGVINCAALYRYVTPERATSCASFPASQLPSFPASQLPSCARAPQQAPHTARAREASQPSPTPARARPCPPPAPPTRPPAGGPAPRSASTASTRSCRRRSRRWQRARACSR
jgi:hypothetical protein